MKMHGIEYFLLLSVGVVIGFIFIPEFALLCGVVLVYLIIDSIVAKVNNNRLLTEKKTIIPKYHPKYNFFS